MKTMKKFSFWFLAALAMLAVSCDDKNDGGDNGGGGSGSGNEEVYTTLGTQQSKDNAGNLLANTYDLGNGNQEYAFKGDVTLDASKKYLLRGWVYITEGSSITIPAGTVIFGDKDTKAALIIERGGKIHATGTADKPIIFTSEQPAGSRKPGDWGGLIICGKAKNNLNEMQIEGGPRTKHGGSDDADNSGELQYVRVEFAGYPFKTDQEINGITFGSVGSGTKIDHLQVSYSNDDSYEWFGGTVDCKYLVAYHGWDDDFDTDNGFSGKVQYALGVRHPKIADQSLSNGFESDNNGDGAATEPYTSCVFANVSLFGPVSNPASYTEQAGAEGSPVDARFQAALHLRRNTQLSIYNSLIAAFPVGLIIENDKGSTTQDWAEQGKLNVTNCVMAGMVKNYQDAQYWKDGSQFDDEDAGSFADGYFNRAEGGNRVFAALSDLGLSGNPLSLSAPVVFPGSDSPLASGAAWTEEKVASGFDKVDYIGAFGPNETAAANWTSGWCNFDPQNTVY